MLQFLQSYSTHKDVFMMNLANNCDFAVSQCPSVLGAQLMQKLYNVMCNLNLAQCTAVDETFLNQASVVCEKSLGPCWMQWSVSPVYVTAITLTATPMLLYLTGCFSRAQAPAPVQPRLDITPCELKLKAQKKIC